LITDDQKPKVRTARIELFFFSLAPTSGLTYQSYWRWAMASAKIEIIRGEIPLPQLDSLIDRSSGVPEPIQSIQDTPEEKLKKFEGNRELEGLNGIIRNWPQTLLSIRSPSTIRVPYLNAEIKKLPMVPGELWSRYQAKSKLGKIFKERYLAIRLRPATTRPMRPLPISNIVEGSGTGAVAPPKFVI
jgi:hypothetical protein